MFRSFSDVEGGRVRAAHRSALEANCNEIFQRTPAVTKEMLHKLQNSGPKKSEICGYEINIKQLSILIALVLLFILSCGFSGIFWGTTMFNDAIRTDVLVLVNGTKKFEEWVRPIPSTFEIYLFNYTNVDAVELGYQKKLHVEEVGPFTYMESVERYNIEFNDDGTVVKYRERYSHDFVPELSKGRSMFDRIVVPNIPLLSAAATSKKSYFLTRMAMSSLFRTLNSKAFITLPAHQFVFGYDDDFYNLAKGVMALTNPLPYEKFGLIAGRSHEAKDTREMYTGKGDMSKVGQIKSIGGKTSLGCWMSDSADRVGGVEDVFVPPNLVDDKQPIDIFMRDFCRKYKLVYQNTSKVLGGVDVYDYVLPENSFHYPDHSEFCTENGCPPQGLYNFTACAYGVPLFLSYPHFYKADPALFNSVTGLNPKPKIWQTYAKVHPLGFVAEGWNVAQINVQVMKSVGITQLTALEDEQFLPVAWMRFGNDADKLPEKAKQDIYDATYFRTNVETILKFGSLLSAFVTFTAIMLVVKGNYCRSVDKNRVMLV